MTEAKYLAIDPGNTSGWATFDEKGNVLIWGQETERKKLLALIGPHLEAVITEDYRNHGWMQQQKWGRNDTSKLIGSIEAICEVHDIPCHLQSNTVKGVGYKWAGLKEPPKNHSISHQFDAIAHGVYWLQVNNIRPVGKALENGL